MKSINNFCKTYKPLIETIGILIALVLLVFTFWSTLISRDILRLSQQQEFNKQLPIWDFAVNDTSDIISVKPFSPDVKIQIANAYFPSKIFRQKQWPIDPPDFKLYLLMFKFDIAALFKNTFPYDKNVIDIAPRGAAPVLLEINYIQYGESRTVWGLFEIQYLIERSSLEPKVQLKGMFFLKYCNKQEGLNELESLAESFSKSLDSLKNKKVK
ncbi:MAG TPA: hypothetical protein VHE59_01165 [Mucilaginibacter sp.]|nr:hypothetical protein [Mucilaginibacter sp.]